MQVVDSVTIDSFFHYKHYKMLILYSVRVLLVVGCFDDNLGKCLPYYLPGDTASGNSLGFSPLTVAYSGCQEKIWQPFNVEPWPQQLSLENSH